MTVPQTPDSMRSTVTRRRFLQILGMTAAAGVAWKAGVALRDDEVATVSATRTLMGTVVNITLIGENRPQAEAAIDAALGRMSALESVLSRHRPDSQVSVLNTTGLVTEPDAALLGLLAMSVDLGGLTAGAFDVTVKPVLDLYERAAINDRLPTPNAVEHALALVGQEGLVFDREAVSFEHPGMAITLDGIGKGYVVDQGVAELREHGFVGVLVEAGGDLMAAGVNASSNPWRIGIQPARSGAAATRIGVQDRAVATSGDYMQAYSADLANHHIIDPRTGYSAPELAGVTVVAPTVARADGLATALMVLGPERGLDLVESLSNVEAMVVTKDATEIRSTGLTSA